MEITPSQPLPQDCENVFLLPPKSAKYIVRLLNLKALKGFYKLLVAIFLT